MKPIDKLKTCLGKLYPCGELAPAFEKALGADKERGFKELLECVSKGKKISQQKYEEVTKNTTIPNGAIKDSYDELFSPTSKLFTRYYVSQNGGEKIDEKALAVLNELRGGNGGSATQNQQRPPIQQPPEESKRWEEQQQRPPIQRPRPSPPEESKRWEEQKRQRPPIQRPRPSPPEESKRWEEQKRQRPPIQRPRPSEESKRWEESRRQGQGQRLSRGVQEKVRQNDFLKKIGELLHRAYNSEKFKKIGLLLVFALITLGACTVAVKNKGRIHSFFQKSKGRINSFFNDKESPVPSELDEDENDLEEDKREAEALERELERKRKQEAERRKREQELKRKREAEALDGEKKRKREAERRKREQELKRKREAERLAREEEIKHKQEARRQEKDEMDHLKSTGDVVRAIFAMAPLHIEVGKISVSSKVKKSIYKGSEVQRKNVKAKKRKTPNSLYANQESAGGHFEVTRRPEKAVLWPRDFVQQDTSGVSQSGFHSPMMEEDVFRGLGNIGTFPAQNEFEPESLAEYQLLEKLSALKENPEAFLVSRFRVSGRVEAYQELHQVLSKNMKAVNFKFMGTMTIWVMIEDRLAGESETMELNLTGESQKEVEFRSQIASSVGQVNRREILHDIAEQLAGKIKEACERKQGSVR